MKTSVHEFEITNCCTCTTYNEDTQKWDDTTECYGCWDDTLYDFNCETHDLQESNETGWWKVSNLRLWSGEVSGYFHATKVEDILRGMTVNSAWTMRYTAYPDRVEYSLSHHDAMGSASTLTAVSEDERERLGLY